LKRKTKSQKMNLLSTFVPLFPLGYIIPFTSPFTPITLRSRFVKLSQQVNVDVPSTLSPFYRTTTLYGGVGVAKSYEWQEEQYEIELKVYVPPNTKAKDVNFSAKSKSIHLSIYTSNNSNDDTKEEQILLNGKREFRGQIDVDRTFWTISDLEEEHSSEEKNRLIVITMEKFIIPPQDQFSGVVEFDWGGVYRDDEDEVLSKNYKEPEELNIKEYAASLGVDIDDINMTMVDKTMFTSGLNMTQDMVRELTKKGYAKEVTKQNDGKEFVTDFDGGGDAIPFQPLGDDISSDEIENINMKEKIGSKGGVIPFLGSPSQTSMLVEDARGIERDASFQYENQSVEDSQKKMVSKEDDPIDALTVVKLKAILKKEKLKVSGNKQELRDRLKNHIKEIMQQKKIERTRVDE